MFSKLNQMKFYNKVYYYGKTKTNDWNSLDYLERTDINIVCHKNVCCCHLNNIFQNSL